MAEKIISPGVFQRETDQSFISPAPIQAGAAIIGPTVKGPELQPTLVTSFGDYKNKFGTTFLSGSNSYEYLTSIAAQKYFANGGRSMLVTRVVSGSFTPATSTRILCNSGSVDGRTATASVDLTGNLPDAFEGFGVFDSTDDSTQFIALSSSFTQTLGASVYYAYDGDFDNLNIEFASNNLPFTINVDGNVISITSSNVGTTQNNYVIRTGSLAQLVFSPGTLDDIATFGGGEDLVSAANTNDNICFTLKTIGKGILLNNTTDIDPDNIEEYSDGSLKTGSLDNLRWEISGINNDNGTFNLEIRRGDDNSNNPIVLETFLGLSLDPESDNYIEKAIGNQYVAQTNYDGQYMVTVNGDYPNISNFVYVDSVSKPTPKYLNNDGSVGVDSSNLSYSSSLPYPASGSFCNAAGSIIPTGRKGNYFENISNVDTQGVLEDDYTIAINILKNKDEYRFNTITTPGIYNKDHASVVASVIELCEMRGDCFYITDLVPYGDTITSVTNEAKEINSNYAGTYWPWVQTPSVELSRNVWTPTSTVMQGVYATNDAIAAPWFAPAGLTRGGLPVIKAEIKLTQGLRDNLYLKKVNPISTFPNTGVVAYGQKTLQTKASALDRINVRRLMISLKNFIGDTAKNLVFEQNTTVTRNKFLNAVNPFLESVQQRQGLYAFRVIMDETNNTADAIDRNQLVGQIFLQPTKTAEFIVLDYTIQPTGATFGE